MGSKTPRGEYEGGNDTPSNSSLSATRSGEPCGAHFARDGDGCIGDDSANGDDDDDNELQGNGGEISTTGAELEAQKKRKKRNRKKSKKKSKIAASGQQSQPPRVPLDRIFPNADFPHGEVQDYVPSVINTARTTATELRDDSRRYWNDDAFLKDYRKAAEIHRQARQWVQSTIQPGQSTLEVASSVEDAVRALLGNDGLETGSCLKSGMGFPTGVCLNHQVAHYTPNPGQKEVILQQKDVVTVDFGVHINGWIVDSAWTMSFDPIYDNLLAAVKAATNVGIKTAGVDVRISDVSAAIQETMESYEVEIGGKTFPVKPVRSLTGHNIRQWHIHGGKSIPFVKTSDQTKMEEGEVFAIETFGSTGRARTYDDTGVYGYSLNQDSPLNFEVPLSSAKKLHKTIRENFSTIPFCRRYLDRLGVDKYLAGMNCLVSNGIVEEFAPLADIKGSYSAQFEHTFLLGETHKEVFSRGEDY